MCYLGFEAPDLPRNPGKGHLTSIAWAQHTGFCLCRDCCATGQDTMELPKTPEGWPEQMLCKVV